MGAGADRGGGEPPRGVLHLVVGPSGVGKDTLIDRARRARPDVVYPKRTITRSEAAAGEDHDAVKPAHFDAMEAAGLFALSWRAHALAYGVPRAPLVDALASSRHVLVNVSRRVLDDARAAFGSVRILSITAPTAVLADRLAARGREDAEEVARRLARAGDRRPSGADVIEIDNGGDLAAAEAAFLAAIAPPLTPKAP